MTREEIDWLNSAYENRISLSKDMWRDVKENFLRENKTTCYNYQEFVYYTSCLIDKLSDDSSLSKAIILSKLLKDGALSFDDNFSFDVSAGNCTTKFGHAVVNGNGCCRHIADFTNDVLRMSGEQTYPYSCMVYDKILDLDVHFLDDGNHIANIIYYDGIPYVYDEWSNSFLRFISDRIAFRKSKLYAYFVPYVLSTYYGLENEDIIKIVNDFELSSKSKQISSEEFNRIYGESIKSVEENCVDIDNFKTKTKSLKKSIYENHKRNIDA